MTVSKESNKCRQKNKQWTKVKLASDVPTTTSSVSTSSLSSCSAMSRYLAGVSKKPLEVEAVMTAWLGSADEGTHPLFRTRGAGL